VTFQDKLRRRAAEINKAKASKEAGLPANALSSYIAKKSIPRADIALKIARALDVPLDWLLDDRQGWPPPKGQKSLENSLADVPFGPLIRELARRYRLDALDVMRQIEESKKIDWEKALAEARALTPGEKISASLAKHLKLAELVSSGVLSTVTRYNIHVAAEFLHEQLPGAELPPHKLSFANAVREFYELGKRGGFDQLIVWMTEHREAMAQLNVSPPLGLSQILDLIDERKRMELLDPDAPLMPSTTEIELRVHGAIADAADRAAEVIRKRQRARRGG
jgi:transcriptional regulator with XRE-family HTH domain